MADPVSAASRISLLLIEELREAAERGEFGVVVRDVKPLDYGVLASAAGRPSAKRGIELRLALVGQAKAVEAARAANPAIAGFVSAREEDAVQWRNDRLRTICVISERPLSKAASLRDFRNIGEAALMRRLCSREAGDAEVAWLQTLWDVLGRNPRLRLSLKDTVRFADELASILPNERSVLAPRHLHLLGLLPDERLADEKSDQRVLRRLQVNREFVDQLRRATNEDWLRLRDYCRRLDRPERVSANRVSRDLRQAWTTGQFSGLDLDAASLVWRAKILQGERSAAGSQPREEVERAVSRLLMEGKESELADIADEISQIASAALEGDIRVVDHDVKRAGSASTASVVETNRDLLNLIRSRSTLREWGGLIEIESDKPDALLEMAAFKIWTPFLIDPVLVQLRAFSVEEVVSSSLVSKVERLCELRLSFLPFAAELAISPIAFLAGKPELQQALEEYLATYEDMLRMASASYSDMLAAADYEAESVLSGLLALELYVYRRANAVEW